MMKTRHAVIRKGKGKYLVSSGGLNYTQPPPRITYPLGHEL